MEIFSNSSPWASAAGQPAARRARPVSRVREAKDSAAPSLPLRRREPGLVQHGGSFPPNLFEVLRSSAQAGPFLAPLGIDEGGRPIWVDLHHRTSRHVLIEGGTPAARAELLRGLAIGLTMTTRPALLQILAIDSTGRELSVLETLPHAVTETANDIVGAQVSLAWLAAELEARVRECRRWPDMVLVVEDIMSLAGAESGRGRAALTTILRSGGASGIHVLGGAAKRTSELKSAGWSRPDVARLIAGERPGWFEYCRGGSSSLLTGVRVTAADLDLVARGYRPLGMAGSGGGHDFPRDARPDSGRGNA